MKFKLNWGTGIAISLITFMGFIIFLVVYSANGTSDYLQENDYYEKGLRHQEHIELINNTIPFKDQIKVDVHVGHMNVQKLNIQMPGEMKLGEVKLHLYRPSDGNMDQRKLITALFDSSNRATYDLSDLQSGSWRVKLNWVDEAGKGYYYETPIML